MSVTSVTFNSATQLTVTVVGFTGYTYYLYWVAAVDLVVTTGAQNLPTGGTLLFGTCAV